MKRSKTGLLFVFLALLISGFLPPDLVAAGEKKKPAPLPAVEAKTVSPYAFSFLPIAFQKRPVLAITVITEFTTEGKKLTPPTQEKPYYYISSSLGFHQEGQGAYKETKISDENMLKLAQNGLAADHYLPADKDHPACFVLYVFWGVHSKLWEANPMSDEPTVVDIKYHNLLTRAQLVGGTKFAKDLAEALQRQARFAGNVAPSMGQIRSNLQNNQAMDPVYLFSIRDDVTRNLVEQVLDDCYYVVVSAYDAASVMKGERKLLWRTTMSTPAQGVSLAETTPALITSGKSFFGKDMADPSIIGKRINRGGTVELGELKVIEMDGKDQPAEKSPQEAPAGKK